MADSCEKKRLICAFCAGCHMLDPLCMGDVIDQVIRAVDQKSPMTISMLNVAKLVKMRKDPLLRESVLSGDVILADGMPLVWLSRLRGKPVPERVAGIDLMYQLYQLANDKKLRVFLLGATQEVLEKIVSITRRDYPGMVIAGYRDGYFTDVEQDAVARQIKQARPDILLVAMSSPKKELFMRRWAEWMDVPVVHGVGGSFDVMAGKTKRAPLWMQKRGLEWLYRVTQEPGRMWKRYLVTNLSFLLRVPVAVVCRRSIEGNRAVPNDNPADQRRM